MIDQEVQEFGEPRPGVIWTAVRQRRDVGWMLWRRVFAGRGDQVAPPRMMVRLLLEDTPRADDAEWVAAELISNALLHSRSGEQGGHFLVEVARCLSAARVMVYDLGGRGEPRFNLPWRHEAREHGHGLRGVMALAAQVGQRGDPLTGHAVWAQLTLTTLITLTESDAVRTAS